MKKQEIFKAFIKECSQRFETEITAINNCYFLMDINNRNKGTFSLFLQVLDGDFYIDCEVEADTDNGIDLYYKSLGVSKIEFFDIEGNDFETIEPLVTQIEMNKLIIEFIEKIELWRDEVTEHHIHRNER